MKNSSIISLFWEIILTISLPFRSLAQPAQWVLDKYEPYNYLYNYNSVAKELAYRLMRPINFDASKKYPVIITLHGGTAFRLPQSPRYNIYSLQEYNEQLAYDSIRSEYPAYVLAPQGK
jgi:predicted peptidase